MCIHSADDGCLGGSHLLAMVSDAAMNIHVYVFARMYIFSVLGCMPSSAYNFLKDGVIGVKGKS